MKLSAAPSESISSVHGMEVDELGVLISDQMESVVRAAVDNYRWESNDEVVHYNLGRAVWDLVWLQESWQLRMGVLASSTCVTGVDVVPNELCHPRPPIVAGDELDRLPLARMSCWG